ncbi:MAG: hypothetical protein JW940_21350 [Polyangiaceae bacterium]|nr:hypothetical protein [Polyangiaceae bacterium]
MTHRVRKRSVFRVLTLGIAGLVWSASVLAESQQPRRAAKPAAPVVGTAQRTAFEVCTGFKYQTEEVDHDDYGMHERTARYGNSNEPREGAMLREVRRIRLGPGRHQVTWSDLPESAELETVVVRLDEGASMGVRLLSHRVTETALDPHALRTLLLNNHAQSEVVSAPGRPQPTRKVFGGGLVSLSDGIVMRVDGELTVLPRSFVDSPFALPKRQLVVVLDVPSSVGAGADVGIEATLLLGRVRQHPPRYTFRFDRAAGAGTLAGSALITDLSGYPLDGAVASWCMQANDRSWITLSSSSATTQTGLLSLADRHPFAFPLPLRFGPTHVATAELLQTVTAPTRETRHTVIPVYELLTRETEPGAVRSWSTRRVLTLPVSGLAENAALPAGSVNVWLAPQAPTPLGRALLVHAPGREVTINAEDALVRTSGRQLNFVPGGRCRGKAVWRLEVPLDLAALGPLKIMLPEPKGTLRLLVRNVTNATVDVAADEPTLTVVAVPNPIARPPTAWPRLTFDLTVQRLRCP